MSGSVIPMNATATTGSSAIPPGATVETPRITLLAESFHCLRGKPGVRPWDPLKLNRWGKSGASHGEKCAVRFILSVWNPYHRWTIGKFDFQDAMGVWDDEIRAAFVAWCRSPWWP